MCGCSGSGMSTLMTLLCSEASASVKKDGSTGEVHRHCNLRMAYRKQDHLTALGPFFDASPLVYIGERVKHGYDGDLQKRPSDPESIEGGLRRNVLANEHGKGGNEAEELVSRAKVGSGISYEVRWAGLDDVKQDTMGKVSKLRMMGLEKVVNDVPVYAQGVLSAKGRPGPAVIPHTRADVGTGSGKALDTSAARRS